MSGFEPLCLSHGGFTFGPRKQFLATQTGMRLKLVSRKMPPSIMRRACATHISEAKVTHALADLRHMGMAGMKPARGRNRYSASSGTASRGRKHLMIGGRRMLLHVNRRPSAMELVRGLDGLCLNAKFIDPKTHGFATREIGWRCQSHANTRRGAR